MTSISLKIDGVLYAGLLRHLMPLASDYEEAAFLFVRGVTHGEEMVFDPIDQFLVGPEGFVVRSPRFLELKDSVRAQLIMRAHQLGASIIEFHSHPRYAPEFSWSDKRGLREFVPHVRWRLKGRPYGAVVVAPAGFDALFWIDKSEMPVALNRLNVDGRALFPTGRSLANWEASEYE
jgi:proteasome lid subunit RPN8/RPN11